ncbi:hypothetical protein OIO90_001379 [Microbotryomycetes sp. JL221]|nr:hypothetical protein OIO90_001379 [Microbotryomycetes sp. JL221]
MTSVSAAPTANTTRGKPRATKTKPVDSARLYRSLHDQLDSGHLTKALKTCDKLLQLDPQDSLAWRTKVQLLISLDRFTKAIDLVNSNTNPLEQSFATFAVVYCLYKTSRFQQAKDKLDRLAQSTTEDDRTALLLRAQVAYRMEQYELSRDEFQGLADTVDSGSPEHQDLQTNIAACEAHINFLERVPAHLSSTAIPSIDTLEQAPVGPLLQSHSKSKSTMATGAAVASTSKARQSTMTKPSKRARILPKTFDESKEADPWRWTRMKERPGMGALIQQKRERARGKNKEKQALLTQGGFEPTTTTQSKSKATSASNSGASGAGGGGTKTKKKKGKK